MNLYLLTQEDNRDWDTYDSVVVCAETEDKARNINPDYSEEWGKTFSSWASAPELVKVKLIGIAIEGLEKGVVLGSFNAG